MFKIVSAPLNIKDMNDDLESNELYVFDYDKSEYKGIQFYEYLSNLTNVDIIFSNTTSYNDKKMLLERYMNDNRFLHFKSFNITIFNIINLYKNIDKRLELSIFSKNEEEKFLDEHKSLISEWIKFYDSLFFYILFLATLPKDCSNKKEQIKKRFEGCTINNTIELSVNMVSLLMDEYYYEYYDSGINESLVNYYPYYFENNLYDEKDIITYIISPYNYYLKILSDMVYDKRFETFMKLCSKT